MSEPDKPDATATDVAKLSEATAPADDAENLIETLARYDVGPELARGGAGRIMRAWDQRLGREVVVKAPLPGRTRARFVQLEGRRTGCCGRSNGAGARSPEPGQRTGLLRRAGSPCIGVPEATARPA
jgi:hypothetical protein